MIMIVCVSIYVSFFAYLSTGVLNLLLTIYDIKIKIGIFTFQLPLSLNVVKCFDFFFFMFASSVLRLREASHPDH